jgi:hypothetical protein
MYLREYLLSNRVNQHIESDCQCGSDYASKQYMMPGNYDDDCQYNDDNDDNGDGNGFVSWAWFNTVLITPSAASN